MSDRTLLDAIEALTHKKRSFDVLRLLIEDGDHATALVVAAKLRSDLDIVLNELSRLSGQPIPADSPAAPLQPPSTAPSVPALAAENVPMVRQCVPAGRVGSTP